MENNYSYTMFNFRGAGPFRFRNIAKLCILKLSKNDLEI